MDVSTRVIHETYVLSQSAHLYVRTAGNPNADIVLIVLHGGPGLSHTPYIGLEHLASAEVLVVTYDQRGCGRSSTLLTQATEANFTTEAYVQDLEAVRQAVASGKKVHLLGHSWGGYVVMAYTVTYPEHLHSLLLLDSVPPTIVGTNAGQQRFQRRTQEYQQQQQGIIPTELSMNPLEYLKQILPVYVYSPDILLHFPVDAIEIAPQHVKELTWKAVGDYDLHVQVAALTLPVQILFGEADPFGSVWAEETRDAFAHAELTYTIFAQCGHFGWVEQPDLFFRVVRDFLIQHTQEESRTLRNSIGEHTTSEHEMR
jgi:pimeloyl-ACP methyl ester carboxylesterase